MIYSLTLVRKVLSAESFVVRNAKDVYDYAVRNCIPSEEMFREHAWLLMLNAAKNLIGQFRLSLGGTGSATFDVRLACKAALDSLAAAVVLVHNHPSGNTAPSQYDISHTKELRNALALFDVSVLDHIIIGDADGHYFSFSEENYPS